jgi:hypothetical protein
VTEPEAPIMHSWLSDTGWDIRRLLPATLALHPVAEPRARARHCADTVADALQLEREPLERWFLDLLAARVSMTLRDLLTRMDEIGCLPGADYLVHGLPAGGFNTTWFCNFIADAAVRGRAARDRGVPPMPVFAYGKTGSSWLTAALSELMDVPKGVISLNYHAAVRAWVCFLSRYPFSIHDHLWPTESALRFLTEHGIARVAVHVRDPRQVLLSLVYHNIAQNGSQQVGDGESAFHTMIDSVIDQSAPHYCAFR